jgi:hypothetical protein
LISAMINLSTSLSYLIDASLAVLRKANREQSSRKWFIKTSPAFLAKSSIKVFIYPGYSITRCSKQQQTSVLVHMISDTSLFLSLRGVVAVARHSRSKLGATDSSFHSEQAPQSLGFSLPWREGVRGRGRFTLTLFLSRQGRGDLCEIDMLRSQRHIPFVIARSGSDEAISSPLRHCEALFPFVVRPFRVVRTRLKPRTTFLNFALSF